MKHAYLILAHNFDVLPYLLQAIDDVRNDVFIHIDKKVSKLPDIKMVAAGIYWLTDRVDVRWGDVSVLKAEFALFEYAVSKGEYAYYHLLSGADMPLRSQDSIHRFFREHSGKEFIGYSQYNYEREVDRKINRYHLFAGDFRSDRTLLSKIRKLIRAVALRIQFFFNIRRNNREELKKGTQWISITHSFITFMLSKKAEMLNRYKYTFCADEIFVHTACWHSPYQKNIFNTIDEGKGCMRAVGWRDGKLVDWKLMDYDLLIRSGALFARKFNKRETLLIERLMDHIELDSACDGK